MSFGIRPTYKKRILVNNIEDTFNLPSYDPDESKRMFDTMLQFSRRSGTSNVSQQEMESMIRKSSINPSYYPQMKDSVNEIIKDKRQDTPANSTSVSNVYGFSASSTSSASSNSFQSIIDEELRRELDKARGIKPDDNKEAKAADDAELTEEQKQEQERKNAQTEEDLQRRIAMIRDRQMLANGFPKSASLLRGYEFRQGGTSGGIRRTATGMIDGF